MQVDAAMLAHAVLHARPQRPDDPAARGSGPADEATAGTTVTAADETIAGQTSAAQPDAGRRRAGARRGAAATPPAPGLGPSPAAPTNAPPPGRAEIAALQQELGLAHARLAPGEDGAAPSAAARSLGHGRVPRGAVIRPDLMSTYGADRTS